MALLLRWSRSCSDRAVRPWTKRSGLHEQSLGFRVYRLIAGACRAGSQDKIAISLPLQSFLHKSPIAEIPTS